MCGIFVCLVPGFVVDCLSRQQLQVQRSRNARPRSLRPRAGASRPLWALLRLGLAWPGLANMAQTQHISRFRPMAEKMRLNVSFRMRQSNAGAVLDDKRLFV